MGEPKLLLRAPVKHRSVFKFRSASFSPRHVETVLHRFRLNVAFTKAYMLGIGKVNSSTRAECNLTEDAELLIPHYPRYQEATATSWFKAWTLQSVYFNFRMWSDADRIIISARSYIGTNFLFEEHKADVWIVTYTFCFIYFLPAVPFPFFASFCFITVW